VRLVSDAGRPRAGGHLRVRRRAGPAPAEGSFGRPSGRLRPSEPRVAAVAVVGGTRGGDGAGGRQGHKGHKEGQGREVAPFRDVPLAGAGAASRLRRVCVGSASRRRVGLGPRARASTASSIAGSGPSETCFCGVGRRSSQPAVNGGADIRRAGLRFNDVRSPERSTPGSARRRASRRETAGERVLLAGVGTCRRADSGGGGLVPCRNAGKAGGACHGRPPRFEAPRSSRRRPAPRSPAGPAAARFSAMEERRHLSRSSGLRALPRRGAPEPAAATYAPWSSSPVVRPDALRLVREPARCSAGERKSPLRSPVRPPVRSARRWAARSEPRPAGSGQRGRPSPGDGSAPSTPRRRTASRVGGLPSSRHPTRRGQARQARDLGLRGRPGNPRRWRRSGQCSGPGAGSRRSYRAVPARRRRASRRMHRYDPRARERRAVRADPDPRARVGHGVPRPSASGPVPCRPPNRHLHRARKPLGYYLGRARAVAATPAGMPPRCRSLSKPRRSPGTTHL